MWCCTRWYGHVRLARAVSCRRRAYPQHARHSAPARRHVHCPESVLPRRVLTAFGDGSASWNFPPHGVPTSPQSAAHCNPSDRSSGSSVTSCNWRNRSGIPRRWREWWHPFRCDVARDYRLECDWVCGHVVQQVLAEEWSPLLLQQPRILSGPWGMLSSPSRRDRVPPLLTQYLRSDTHILRPLRPHPPLFHLPLPQCQAQGRVSPLLSETSF
ncbi:hypothetical protein B0H10DRAFT_2448284 [Mycena sp. CBHHK59/15]|nr:hypothetical protein B0H10DRAFT_2448284 [Mycena sp. CBHHK59/15]